jgi:hypothetical protein
MDRVEQAFRPVNSAATAEGFSLWGTYKNSWCTHIASGLSYCCLLTVPSICTPVSFCTT